MFDIGFAELILLAGLGLIVLGPQRLPKVAVQLGRWVGQARRMSRTLMYQLRQEVNLDDPSPFSTRKPSTPASAGAGGGNTVGKKTAGKAETAGSSETSGKTASSGSSEAAGEAAHTNGGKEAQGKQSSRPESDQPGSEAPAPAQAESSE